MKTKTSLTIGRNQLQDTVSSCSSVNRRDLWFPDDSSMIVYYDTVFHSLDTAMDKLYCQRDSLHHYCQTFLHACCDRTGICVWRHRNVCSTAPAAPPIKQSKAKQSKVVIGRRPRPLCSDVNPCPCRSSPWQVVFLNLSCNTHSIVLIVIYLFSVMGFTVIYCELSLCVHCCCLIAIVGLSATCSK